jgi:hypothetical protein
MKDEAIKLPPLPEPVFVDGRLLYTRAALLEFGKRCYNTDREDWLDESLQSSHSVDDLMNIFGMKK